MTSPSTTDQPETDARDEPVDKLAAYRLRRDEDRRRYGRQQPIGPQITRLFQLYIRPQLKFYLIALGLLVIYSASVAALPYLLENVVDRFLTAKDSDAIRNVAFLGGAIVLTRAVTDFLQKSALSYASLRATRAMQEDTYDALLKQDYAFFLANPPGQLIERAWNTIRALGSLGQTILINIGRDLLSALGLIGYMLFSNWVWSLMMLLLAPLLLVPLLVANRVLRVLAQRRAGVEGGAIDAMTEVVTSIRSVKNDSGEAFERKRLGARITELYDIGVRNVWFAGGVAPVSDLMAAIALTLILLFGGSQVIAGTASPGKLIAFLGAVILVIEPIRRLLKLNVTIQSAIPNIDRMFDILDREPQITDAPDATPLNASAAVTVSFRDVDFSYDGQVAALDGLSFSAQPGKMTALVGASGSGKSTVTALLTRLFDVDRGGVFLNERDVRTLPISDLRANVAVVAQNAALFNGTVAENIRYGNPDLTAEDLTDAADIAQVSSFAERLPDGMATEIGSRGDRLSGGQKQRVAIARALGKNAPVVVLDEATSALDNETEKAFVAEIETLQERGDKTLLVIAHRLSTVKTADHILVLEAGRLVEQGTYDELRAGTGPFSRMAAAG